MPLVEFKGVKKGFGGREVLKEVNFEIEEGEFVFLLGPTGAGKTTTLKLIYAELLPDRGEVRVLGQDTRSLKSKGRQLLRRRLGLVFQDFKLLGDRNVLDNVVFGLEMVGVSRRVAVERALATLEELGLAERAREPVSGLSGGECQRVAIARALVREPELLLADEPTGNLDPEASKAVIETLRYANRVKGVTVLLATNDHTLLELVPEARVLGISEGVVEELGR